MHALQVVKPRSIKPVQVPIPALGAESRDQILVHTRWVAICGSDIPFFTGSKRLQSYPLVPGAQAHECVGQVVESRSDRFRPGDLVVAMPDGNQGLAEFFLAQADRSVRLPAGLDTGISCLIQPLSTVMNGVDRLGEIGGRTFAVVGLGSMGLLFCWLLRKQGAGKIIGVDPIENRCQAAERWGAIQTYSMRSVELVHSTRQNPEDWDSPQVCIECVGHQADTLNDCLALVGKQGTVVAFGVPDHPVYAIEYEVFFRKNATLMAVVTPDWRDYLAQASHLFAAHCDELATLVTHRFPIREAEAAFSLYESRQNGVLRILLDASNWGD